MFDTHSDDLLTSRRIATPETLNVEMNFGLVIYSHGDGTISNAFSLNAPEVIQYQMEGDRWVDEDVDPDWDLLTGYTQQYGYSGRHMHASEYIGGDMARDILDTPGFYVATEVTSIHIDPKDDGMADSWVVAYRGSVED